MIIGLNSVRDHLQQHDIVMVYPSNITYFSNPKSTNPYSYKEIVEFEPKLPYDILSVTIDIK